MVIPQSNHPTVQRRAAPSILIWPCVGQVSDLPVGGVSDSTRGQRPRQPADRRSTPRWFAKTRIADVAPSLRSPNRGFLAVDIMVAMALLFIAILPLAYSFDREQRLFRAYYFRAVAMELVDGEMEALTAGDWKTLPEGRQEYGVKAASAKNLPPGHFFSYRQGRLVRLEWVPDRKDKGGTVKREVTMP